MPRIALIDGDMYAFQVAASSQVEVYFENMLCVGADIDTAKHNLDQMIEGFMETLDAEAVHIAISDPAKGNFRKDVLPTYKLARVNAWQPVLRKPMMEHLQDAYRCTHKPGLEGDDILGIWATGDNFFGGYDKIVVSGDKDLKYTIPGAHWNPAKDFHTGIVQITEEQADYGHLFQTLTGDAVDGYKGIPGIGPKKAAKILEHPELTMWEAIVQAYEKAGLTEEDALVQARVARILRASDYDFEKQQPILWSPST